MALCNPKNVILEKMRKAGVSSDNLDLIDEMLANMADSEELIEHLGDEITYSFNGVSKPKTESITHAELTPSYIIIKTPTITLKFNRGQDRSTNLGNTKRFVEAKGFGARVNALPTHLGSESASTKMNYEADKLRKDALKSIEGIKKIANELFALDKGKLPDSYKQYVMQLLDTIDPEFIPDLNLYLNTEADKNMGMIDNENIIIDATQKEFTASNEMTASEVYAHEMLHSITKFAIENSRNNNEVYSLVEQIEHLRDEAAKSLTWEDLLPEQSIDSAKEAEIAKKRYDYIFNDKNSVHEFIAHGLTNPQLMSKLKDLRVVEDKNDNVPLLDALRLFVKKMLGMFFGEYSASTVNVNQHQALIQLSFELMNHNNKAVNSLHKARSMETKISKLLDLGNMKIADVVERITDKMKEGEVTAPPINASRWEYAKWVAKYLPKLMLRDDMAGYRELIAYVFKVNPESMIPNIMRDVSQPDELERTIEKLGMMSDQIDQQRELTVDVFRKVMLSKFSRELTKTEEEALTLIGLDTDLTSLEGQYSDRAINEMLADPRVLRKEIANLEAEIKELDAANANWFNNQARGLGFYLATHKAGIAQNLNAHNIVTGVLTDSVIESNEEVQIKVDNLATLYGLNYSKPEAKFLFRDLRKKEPEGVKFMLKQHKAIKEESLNSIFDSETMTIKGYTKEQFDSDVDVAIRPLDMKEDMESQGYTMMRILQKDPNDKSEKEMAIYQSKLHVNQNYNRAATRMTNMQKRGTSLTDIGYMMDEDTAMKRASMDKKKMDTVRKSLVERMQAGTIEPHQDNIIVPVLNPDGRVVDYRYMMTKADKKDILEQNTNASETLGRTLASIQDKVDTNQQNRAVLDLILSDMQENYIEGHMVGKNNKLYIRIEANSPNKDVNDIYRILPHHMKQAIKDSPNGYIAVRRDMLHNYFGFRDLSVMDMWKLEKFTPQVLARAIRMAEQLWKEFIKISKVDIVIRTPMVFIGNVISNFMYSIIDGYNPVKVFKMTLQNMKNVRNYMMKVEEIERLSIESKITRKNGAKIKALRKELSLNPVHDLMEAGMYQAIIEDVSRQDFKSSNRLARKIDEKTSSMPEFFRQGAHWIYLSEKTGFFKTMTQATQYSDFVARATQYQLMGNKGIDKDTRLKVVLDAFINYNKPASSFEQYLNDMGLIMFTKYAKRIQRAIFRNSKSKPLNVLLAMLAQEWVLDVDDIYDQNLLSRSWTNIGINPIDHLERVLKPTTLEYLGVL